MEPVTGPSANLLLRRWSCSFSGVPEFSARTLSAFAGPVNRPAGPNAAAGSVRAGVLYGVMALPDLRSEATVRDLAADRLVWPTAPWSAPEAAEALYRGICKALCGRRNLRARIEWNHYGSGYASFIDAWFYRDTDAFRAAPGTGGAHDYVGLWVLFHRRMPFYAVGEGQKSWNETGGASYLPSMNGVDAFTCEAVRDLSHEIEPWLSDHMLIRLRKDELRRPIPADIAIDTNLGARPFHLFDALFHWMD